MRKLGAVLAVVGTMVAATFGLAACGDEAGGKEGGALKVSFAFFPDYLDPQLSQTVEGWSAMYNTYIPLLTYAHAEDKAGSEVVPGLAESLPEISKDGKTYDLTLRKGLKYSDGTPVRASDFKASVERLFELESGGSPFFSDIVGAEEFAETKQGGISGIQANDRTGEITIELTRPRGTFVNELAMMYTAPLPPDTPAKDQSPTPPPATGPYEIVESKPGRSWSYERNPEWAGNNAELMPDLPSGHVDKIEAEVVRNQSIQVNDVESGKTNWMFDPLPPDRVAQVKQRYEGTQFRPEPSISTYFFWMNTTQPPFDDLKVRQAVNHAIDPAAVERVYAGELIPSQQILPEGMPGYEKFELYPHDLQKAKALVAQANPSDRSVTVWSDNFSPNDEIGAYVQDVLDQIGFDAKLKTLGDPYFSVIGNTSTPDLDIGWANWFEDYPHPNDFFEPLLSGASIAPVSNGNFAQIDDPKLNRKIDELGSQQLSPQVEEEYAQLDREFMEQAPWAPLGAREVSLFVSDDVDMEEVVWNPTFWGDMTSFQFK
ncbi:MAG TPA: ABC transporter substrate-binding protein [Solirubrobacterales bacterium]|nr:ABC transporter substrate-binding protein [Solirubrobacterales bacterium]